MVEDSLVDLVVVDHNYHLVEHHLVVDIHLADHHNY